MSPRGCRRPPSGPGLRVSSGLDSRACARVPTLRLSCSLPRLCEARPARLGLRLNKSPMKVVTSVRRLRDQPMKVITSDSPRLRNRPMKAITSYIRRSRDRPMKVIALTGDWNAIARAGNRVDHSSNTASESFSALRKSCLLWVGVGLDSGHTSNIPRLRNHR